MSNFFKKRLIWVVNSFMTPMAILSLTACQSGTSLSAEWLAEILKSEPIIYGQAPAELKGKIIFFSSKFKGTSEADKQQVNNEPEYEMLLLEPGKVPVVLATAKAPRAGVSPDGRLVAYVRDMTKDAYVIEVQKLDSHQGLQKELRTVPNPTGVLNLWTHKQLFFFWKIKPDKEYSPSDLGLITLSPDLEKKNLHLIWSDEKFTRNLSEDLNEENRTLTSGFSGLRILDLQHQLTFVSSETGKSKLNIADLSFDSDRPQLKIIFQLITAEENVISPSWSPDGKQIAFWSRIGNTFVPKIMKADGSGLRTLFTLTENDFGAPIFHWSPDGSHLLFEKNLDIYSVRADGSQLHNLTNDGRESLDSSPIWSPDGKQILFVSRKSYAYGGNNSELQITQADGSNKFRLTWTNGDAIAPLWINVKQ